MAQNSKNATLPVYIGREIFGANAPTLREWARSCQKGKQGINVMTQNITAAMNAAQDMNDIFTKLSHAREYVLSAEKLVDEMLRVMGERIRVLSPESKAQKSIQKAAKPIKASGNLVELINAAITSMPMAMSPSFPDALTKAEKALREALRLAKNNPANGGTDWVSQISAGDTVVIENRFGQQQKGRAVMRSSAGGWTLNMGGAHGTPGLADNTNIVRVIPKRERKSAETKAADSYGDNETLVSAQRALEYLEGMRGTLQKSIALATKPADDRNAFANYLAAVNLNHDVMRRGKEAQKWLADGLGIAKAYPPAVQSNKTDLLARFLSCFRGAQAINSAVHSAWLWQGRAEMHPEGRDKMREAMDITERQIELVRELIAIIPSAYSDGGKSAKAERKPEIDPVQYLGSLIEHIQRSNGISSRTLDKAAGNLRLWDQPDAAVSAVDLAADFVRSADRALAAAPWNDDRSKAEDEYEDFLGKAIDQLKKARNLIRNAGSEKSASTKASQAQDLQKLDDAVREGHVILTSLVQHLQKQRNVDEQWNHAHVEMLAAHNASNEAKSAVYNKNWQGVLDALWKIDEHAQNAQTLLGQIANSGQDAELAATYRNRAMPVNQYVAVARAKAHRLNGYGKYGKSASSKGLAENEQWFRQHQMPAVATVARANQRKNDPQSSAIMRELGGWPFYRILDMSVEELEAGFDKERSVYMAAEGAAREIIRHAQRAVVDRRNGVSRDNPDNPYNKHAKLFGSADGAGDAISSKKAQSLAGRLHWAKQVANAAAIYLNRAYHAVGSYASLAKQPDNPDIEELHHIAGRLDQAMREVFDLATPIGVAAQRAAEKEGVNYPHRSLDQFPYGVESTLENGYKYTALAIRMLNDVGELTQGTKVGGNYQAINAKLRTYAGVINKMLRSQKSGNPKVGKSAKATQSEIQEVRGIVERIYSSMPASLDGAVGEDSRVTVYNARAALHKARNSKGKHFTYAVNDAIQNLQFAAKDVAEHAQRAGMGDQAELRQMSNELNQAVSVLMGILRDEAAQAGKSVKMGSDNERRYHAKLTHAIENLNMLSNRYLPESADSATVPTASLSRDLVTRLQNLRNQSPTLNGVQGIIRGIESLRSRIRRWAMPLNTPRANEAMDHIDKALEMAKLAEGFAQALEGSKSSKAAHPAIRPLEAMIRRLKTQKVRASEIDALTSELNTGGSFTISEAYLSPIHWLAQAGSIAHTVDLRRNSGDEAAAMQYQSKVAEALEKALDLYRKDAGKSSKSLKAAIASNFDDQVYDAIFQMENKLPIYLPSGTAVYSLYQRLNSAAQESKEHRYAEAAEELREADGLVSRASVAWKAAKAAKADLLHALGEVSIGRDIAKALAAKLNTRNYDLSMIEVMIYRHLEDFAIQCGRNWDQTQDKQWYAALGDAEAMMISYGHAFHDANQIKDRLEKARNVLVGGRKSTEIKKADPTLYIADARTKIDECVTNMQEVVGSTRQAEIDREINHLMQLKDYLARLSGGGQEFTNADGQSIQGSLNSSRQRVVMLMGYPSHPAAAALGKAQTAIRNARRAAGFYN